MPDDSNDWVKYRNDYGWPPGKMVSADHDGAPDFAWGDLALNVSVPPDQKAKWESSIDLDRYHERLLLSENDKELLTGFCSVMFWGNILGRGGRPIPERALSRVNWFRDGRNGGAAPTPNTEVIGLLKEARLHTQVGSFDDALTALRPINNLAMAFATKVIMFMAPDKCAVYDKVISERLDDDKCTDLYVDPRGRTRAAYEKQSRIYKAWCERCESKADDLNKLGALWTDWDRTSHPFRAVDVERAYFAMGRSGRDKERE